MACSWPGPRFDGVDKVACGEFLCCCSGRFPLVSTPPPDVSCSHPALNAGLPGDASPVRTSEIVWPDCDGENPYRVFAPGRRPRPLYTAYHAPPIAAVADRHARLPTVASTAYGVLRSNDYGAAAISASAAAAAAAEAADAPASAFASAALSGAGASSRNNSANDSALPPFVSSWVQAFRDGAHGASHAGCSTGTAPAMKLPLQVGVSTASRPVSPSRAYNHIFPESAPPQPHPLPPPPPPASPRQLQQLRQLGSSAPDGSPLGNPFSLFQLQHRASSSPEARRRGDVTSAGAGAGSGAGAAASIATSDTSSVFTADDDSASFDCSVPDDGTVSGGAGATPPAGTAHVLPNRRRKYRPMFPSTPGVQLEPSAMPVRHRPLPRSSRHGAPSVFSPAVFARAAEDHADNHTLFSRGDSTHVFHPHVSGSAASPPPPPDAPFDRRRHHHADSATASVSASGNASGSVLECVCCFDRLNRSAASLLHGSTAHMCCCMDCADLLARAGMPCPICRRHIDQVVQTFFA